MPPYVSAPGVEWYLKGMSYTLFHGKDNRHSDTESYSHHIQHSILSTWCRPYSP